MNDYLIRAYSKQAGLRAVAGVTTDLVDEASRRHGTSALGTAALGNGLTAVALLGALLKVQERIAFKIEGDGPLRKLIAESDAYGHIRGYLAAEDASANAGFAGFANDAIHAAFGAAPRLLVVQDFPRKQRYESAVPLPDGHLDEALRQYFLQSEQVPTLVAFQVEMSQSGELVAAGGVIVQTLPGIDPETLQPLSARLQQLGLPGRLLAEGHTPETILAALFADTPYDLLETRTLAFRCTCSREQTRRALAMLSDDDLIELIVEGEAEVECQFCHEQYQFDRSELIAIQQERL